MSNCAEISGWPAAFLFLGGLTFYFTVLALIATVCYYAGYGYRAWLKDKESK